MIAKRNVQTKLQKTIVISIDVREKLSSLKTARRYLVVDTCTESHIHLLSYFMKGNHETIHNHSSQ